MKTWIEFQKERGFLNENQANVLCELERLTNKFLKEDEGKHITYCRRMACQTLKEKGTIKEYKTKQDIIVNSYTFKHFDEIVKDAIKFGSCAGFDKLYYVFI